MTKKKSGFWTFCFSLLPGAGEMYMGFMKMGVSLMVLFFGLFALGMFFSQGLFLTMDAVVWFYSFFHAHNLRAMDDEDFYALEDDYLIHLDDSGKEFWNKNIVSKYRKIIAAVLILMGASIIWNNFMDMIYWVLPAYLQDYIYSISYRLPQILLGIGIIAVGIFLIRGKKKELLEDKSVQFMEEQEDGREENGKDA